ncbi:hypothetical protein BCT30_05265 [Enterovibrio norvegicus]|uniref:A nuclease of the HNH/ENDO VII superfamily with conserved WHH n=3 Tax=Enterovibrio norvegicus TaxID=188144 RepID=A0A1I5NJ89_9GAMM|nr:hypothetical protein [Enterovibrio norvegicus]OEE62333.1 hypothetical protein A1OS_18185 [Enterovibrio norvegicus]OEF48767.1 hypothetical protein A1OW_14480 [Enterovibrio norvegicus]OEF55180.1 hypothetical protein A1OU_22635 [Enterovibrio norvegicus]PMH72319.1 hypothetical protein BCU62_23070 [Enterovibrio norvegicus]PMI28532.1 hypothetical protein BCU47_21205 [Enterovibrio norvegicus]
MSNEYGRLLEEARDKKLWEEAGEIAKNNPQIITDITGIFDPTPASDGISTIISVAKGDWLGAGLSLVSMIPYAGDALAKPAKFAKYGSKVQGLVGLMFKKFDNVASMTKSYASVLSKKQIVQARMQALKKAREQMVAARKRAFKCKKCEQFKRKHRMPTTEHGTWKPKGANDPNSSNFGKGEFTFNKKIKLPDPPEGPGGYAKSIKYDKGFPVFNSSHVKGKRYLADVTNNVKKDTQALTAAGVKHPGDGWTLHHFEDGAVGYVPTDLHNASSHAGSRSIMKTEAF